MNNSRRHHWWRNPDGFRKFCLTFNKLLVLKNIFCNMISQQKNLHSVAKMCLWISKTVFWESEETNIILKNRKHDSEIKRSLPFQTWACIDEVCSAEWFMINKCEMSPSCAYSFYFVKFFVRILHFIWEIVIENFTNAVKTNSGVSIHTLCVSFSCVVL